MFSFEKEEKYEEGHQGEDKGFPTQGQKKCFWPKGKKIKGNRLWRRKMLPRSWNLQINEDNVLVPCTSLGRHGRVERHPKKKMHLQTEVWDCKTWTISKGMKKCMCIPPRGKLQHGLLK